MINKQEQTVNSKKAKELRRMLKFHPTDPRENVPVKTGILQVIGTRGDYRKAKKELQRKGVA